MRIKHLQRDVSRFVYRIDNLYKPYMGTKSSLFDLIFGRPVGVPVRSIMSLGGETKKISEGALRVGIPNVHYNGAHFSTSLKQPMKP
jgi:hypothetical protein